MPWPFPTPEELAAVQRAIGDTYTAWDNEGEHGRGDLTALDGGLFSRLHGAPLTEEAAMWGRLRASIAQAKHADG